MIVEGDAKSLCDVVTADDKYDYPLHDAAKEDHGGYRPDVDGLRAIAVIAVIVYHFREASLPGGFLGVDIFFVISGFVITNSLWDRPHDNLRSLFTAFYARRIRRLLPALICCLTLTFVVGALFISPKASEFSQSADAALYSLIGVSNVYFFRVSTDYFSWTAALNLFTHTWSLGVEEQFYLLFPVLLWSANRASSDTKAWRFLAAGLGGLAALSFALYLWLSKSTPGAAYFLMPSRFWELSAGCLTAIALKHIRTVDRGDLAFLPWVGTAFVIAGVLSPERFVVYTTPVIVIGTVFLILGPTWNGNAIHGFLTRKSVIQVGILSYSLYLWHWPVLALSRWTIGVSLWTAPLQVAAILGLSTMSYSWVERPLRRIRWSSSEAVTIAYGLGGLVCAAGFIFLLKGGPIDLYTGSPMRMAAEGAKTLANDKWYAGKLQWRARNCILASNRDVDKKIDADVCRLAGPGQPNQRQFLVVGNSFSVAEYEMYQVLSERRMGSVIATSSFGASPAPALKNDSQWNKANDYYWRTVIPELTSRLHSGDIVIMIFDLADFVPAKPSADTSRSLMLLEKSLDSFAKDLGRRGIKVVFQSPNPLIQDAHCTPEMAMPQWFNTANQERCSYLSKSQTLDRIRPVREILRVVRTKNPNLFVLDLVPTLCREALCQFYNVRRQFLYRDYWAHPSIEADRLARPEFLHVVGEATEH